MLSQSCQYNGDQETKTVSSHKDNSRKQLHQNRINNKTANNIAEDSLPNAIYHSKISKNIGELVDMGIDEISPRNKVNLATNSESPKYIPTNQAIISTTEKPLRFLKVTFDNDIFNNTDYYYTNGVNIELFNSLAEQSPLSKLLVGLKSNNYNLYGFSLIQNIYTPTNPDLPEISEGDRPFSAFLTIGQVRESYNLKKKLSLVSKFNIGVLGPASLGGVVQSSIHNIEPVGWNNQINNNLVIDYSAKIEKGIISNPNLEINITASGNIGTVFNKIAGGLYLRAGSFLPVYRGNISDNKHTFQYWFFVEGKTNLVFYDATLQGGFLGGNDLYTLNSSNINRLVINASIGFAAYYKSVGLEFQNFYISPEFKNAYDFRWGRIKLIFKI